MKLTALAVDYDGTISTDGTLNRSVREAIGEVRRQGVSVALVTGRRLAELRRLAPDLTCFDVIVAENGAVLEFPASSRHVVLGHPPPAAIIQELRRRRIAFEDGESVIEADGASAGAILDVIRTLQQPLTLAFNQSRLMVLPQGVSKSTGLRRALFALRLSIHNTVGIGNAENDHDLLDACEVGVAVAWGTAPLRAIADEVIEGTGPEAVADYIRGLAGQSRLSSGQMGRRRLLLGYEHSGEPLRLAVRGRTIIIAGEPGTGKSWLAGLLCEQLILQGYCLCLIDPEGDYRELEALPGVITLGGDDPPPQARELIRSLRHPDVSVIVDLSKITYHQKREYLRTLLPMLIALRRRTGLPHKILLDEAHYFVAGKEGCEYVDPALAGYILVTYRVSTLDASIAAPNDVVVMVTRETDPYEIDMLHKMCGAPASSVPHSVFRDLATNEAALLPGAEEAGGTIRRFNLAPRLTAHVRHQSKYLDMPVGDSEAFVFSPNGRSPARARTLKAFSDLLVGLPRDQIEGHLRRHDFSRWLDVVFRDRPLAAHLHGIETRVQTDDAREIAQAVAQAIRARYETEEER